MDPIRRGTPLRTISVDGTKVRLFAEVFGLSLRELARRMGCSHVYLLHIIDGRKAISTRFAPRLVGVLQEVARTVELNAFVFMRDLAPSLIAESQPSPIQAPPSEIPSQVA